MAAKWLVGLLLAGVGTVATSPQHNTAAQDDPRVPVGYIGAAQDDPRIPVGYHGATQVPPGTPVDYVEGVQNPASTTAHQGRVVDDPVQPGRTRRGRVERRVDRWYPGTTAGRGHSHSSDRTRSPASSDSHGRRCAVDLWGTYCQYLCPSECTNVCDSDTGACPAPSTQPACDGPLPVPQDVTVTEVTHNGFFVTWTDIPQATQCGLQYKVLVYQGSGLISPSVSSRGRGMLVSGLHPNTDYAVYVRTFDGQTTSGYSSRVPVKTGISAPDAPVVRHEVSGRQVTFRWTKTATDLGSVTYRYRHKILFKICSSNPDFGHWSSSTHSTSTIITAAPYTTVVLQVYSENEGGSGQTATHSGEVPQEVPGVGIESVDCTPYSQSCIVRLQRDCTLFNGPKPRVEYSLLVEDDSLQNLEKASVRRSQEVDQQFQARVPLTGLLPYTQYKLTVWPANAAGENTQLAKTSSTFTTKAAVPGRVTNFQVHGGDRSITVTWSAPSDHPPKGRLQKFRIKWKRVGYSYWNYRYKNAPATSYTITNLQPKAQYTIEVSAKNDGVERYGSPATITGTPQEGRPSPVRNLREDSVTKTEIGVKWTSPLNPAGDIQHYMASLQLHHKTIENLIVVGSTHQFTGLTPATSYTVAVSACNSAHCSTEETATMWTRPEKPRLLTEVLGTTSPSTITLQLPSPATLPVWQWVIVMKNTEEHVEVENTREQRLREGLSARFKEQAEKMVRDENYLKKQDLEYVWVASKVFQEENNVKSEFVVGDNQTYEHFVNKPLERDNTYLVTVVTEAVAGPYTEVTVSEPHVFTAQATGSTHLLSLLLLLFLLLLLIIPGYLFWKRRKKSESTVSVLEFDDIHLNNGSAEIPRQDPPTAQEGVLEDEYLQEEETQEELMEVKESVYANLSRQVTKDQAEAYLSRVIHSQELAIEFRSVPSAVPSMSCSDGERLENRPKNRYKNNLPYNDTRVKLPLLPSDPFSDYINASYIQGPSTPRAYIATQGPKDYNKDTVGDFWRMLWHTRSNIVIMVTNLIENGKIKVAQYWPEEGQQMTKDDIKVKLISEENKLDFVIRHLQISKTGKGKSRLVKQYQYTAWPDHGVPQNPYGLAQMIKLLSQEPLQGPITVHCSAGIGRTGTIILVLHMLDQLKTASSFDPHQALHHLRQGRSRLVENSSQYSFGHALLLEILAGVNTSFTCTEFLQMVDTLRVPKPPTNTSTMCQQYQKLKALPNDLVYKMGSKAECAHLNRTADILPADSRIVFLQNFSGEPEGQYINAIRVNTFDRQDAYLAGEHPLPHTVKDAWRMVYEKRASVWVLLHELPQQDPEYPSVLPTEGTQRMGRVEVCLTGQQEYNNFTEYYVTVSVPQSRLLEPLKCVVVMMKGWPHTHLLPASPEPLLAVMERADSLITAKSCSFFTCKDGASGTGVMMALLHTVERIRLVQEVDVYRSVLSVLYDRPQFITHVDQYDFLHTAVQEYLIALNHYGNFR